MAKKLPQVNVLTRNNRAGLTRDLALVVDTLNHQNFDATAINMPHRGRWSTPFLRARSWLHNQLKPQQYSADINIMLQHVYPDYLARAKYNVLIPNPEWFQERWQRDLAKFDLILTKTHHAERIFQKLGYSTQWVGFTSVSQYLPDIQKQRTFLHTPGRSGNKGTRRLLALWQKHPDWPQLTILWRKKDARQLPSAKNITIIDHYIDDAELKKLQNSHLFHLCPSQTEGYGHYIAEPMSIGGIVITTDAPPMNELITPERGMLVQAHASGKQRLATLYDFDDNAMQSCIEHCIQMSAEEANKLAENAQIWFKQNAQDFAQHLSAALETLQ